MLSMAQLIVRNLDDKLVEALKLRAAKRGRSTEAEHREILREALVKRPRLTFKEMLLAMPAGGEDEDFAIPREKGRRVKL